MCTAKCPKNLEYEVVYHGSVRYRVMAIAGNRSITVAARNGRASTGVSMRHARVRAPQAPPKSGGGSHEWLTPRGKKGQAPRKGSSPPFASFTQDTESNPQHRSRSDGVMAG